MSATEAAGVQEDQAFGREKNGEEMPDGVADKRRAPAC